MQRKTAAIIALIAIALAAAGTTMFLYRSAIREAVAARTKPPLPPPETYEDARTPPPAVPQPEPRPAPEEPQLEPPKPAPAPAPSGQPASKNLALPFMSQAPHADWSLPYQEACEEASILMAAAYLNGETSVSADEADRRILAMVEWENGRFGYYEDTDAEETSIIVREYLDLDAEVVPISSIDDVKREIAKGHAVALPAAGRMLKNPYFTGQGPLYHMLTVKGYTADGKIIANDPGTRRGADFLYPEATLWNAIHDWNGGEVAEGRKVMIVITKK